jgi:hypothetical protein
MGLDIVMIGAKSLAETANEDLSLALTVSYLVRSIPDAAQVDIGEPDAVLADGYRLGRYAALHVLRGLAVAYDELGESVRNLSEDELESAIDDFYLSEQDTPTRFRHLIDHSDAEGYYVPLEIGEPVGIEYEPARTDDDSEAEAETVSIGSSLALLRELNELQAVLGLDGDLGELGEETFERRVSEHRWPTAAHVWGVLRWCARESAGKKLFIQFC